MRLLFLTDWTYPCDHRFLSRVYNEELSGGHNEIVWVMREDDESEPGVDDWNGDPVHVLPTRAYNPVRWILARAVGGAHPVQRVYERHRPFDAVQVRNDLVMANQAVRLAAREGLTYFHQQSHLKAETLLEETSDGVTQRAESVLKGIAGRQLRRQYLERADVVLPISYSMENYLREVEGNDTQMEVVTTGADTTTDPATVDPARSREAFSIGSNHVLLYIGTFAPVRQLEFLFDVLAMLNEDVELVMAGGRDAENRSRLERFARERGVDGQTTFTGWIKEKSLLDSLVRAATVGVSPIPTDTILRTNAPIKTLEYLAMETPVVATDTPDQRRVLTESDGGLTAPYAAEAFVDAVEEILEATPDRRAEMGARGREYVCRYRSFDVLADRVRDVYEQYGVIDG